MLGIRRLAMPQRERDFPGFQRAAVETGVDGRAQHPLGIAQRSRVIEALGLQIGQGLAVNRAGRFGDAQLRPALSGKTVVSVALHGNAVAGPAAEVAFRRYSEETFAIFRNAKFRDRIYYQTPGGVAVRYLGCWTRDGVPVRLAGSALLQIEGGRIQRIGVEMNQEMLDRVSPA